jgi:phosphomevalonate kinase
VAYQVVSCISYLLISNNLVIAGGYDAIWLLVIDPGEESGVSPASLVEKVWLGWQEMTVTPLMAEESNKRGIQLEDFNAVPGLQDAVRE